MQLFDSSQTFFRHKQLVNLASSYHFFLIFHSFLSKRAHDVPLVAIKDVWLPLSTGLPEVIGRRVLRSLTRG
jgi:hypothetical protein